MDLRAPVGVLFLILGGMLTAYGLVSEDRAETYLGFNVNLWWGAAMFLFGAVMAAAARYASRRRPAGKASREVSAGAPR